MLFLSAVPDEVLVNVLQAHSQRYAVRAVARRCREVVEDNFEIRRFQPPVDQVFCVDFEIDHHMTKHLYCAHFGGASAGDAGGVAGAVTFVNWVPAYWRSSPGSRRDVRHRLGESDAITLWRLVAKVRDQQSCDARALGELSAASSGHLTVSEGGSCGGCSPASKREVIGRLSASDTELVLKVLDHRKNAAAEPVLAS